MQPRRFDLWRDILPLVREVHRHQAVHLGGGMFRRAVMIGGPISLRVVGQLLVFSLQQLGFEAVAAVIHNRDFRLAPAHRGLKLFNVTRAEGSFLTHETKEALQGRLLVV